MKQKSRKTNHECYREHAAVDVTLAMLRRFGVCCACLKIIQVHHQLLGRIYCKLRRQLPGETTVRMEVPLNTCLVGRT
ncbi:hypothetical protein T03_10819 [Trichinella britovi]|uniref:Uncharacterized protein n=1 Tax=Trichinella britovi TaxID=45882 RepID=A0A0V1CEI9_TRIBR|nr:hypothetical protein T03_10819 [Trichinella britovi]